MLKCIGAILLGIQKVINIAFTELYPLLYPSFLKKEMLAFEPLKTSLFLILSENVHDLVYYAFTLQGSDNPKQVFGVKSKA